MQRILLVPNIDNPQARDAARLIADSLRGEADVVVCSADPGACGLEPLEVTRNEIGVPDLVVALGGDGTVLKAAHLLGGADAPILGVNLGRLGFLSGAGERDPIASVRAALAGEGIEDTRAVLSIAVTLGGRVSGRHEAVNEAFVGRGAGARAVELAVDVDGERLARWTCDGVIVASPTGSTAYSLSAGGPLVAPDVPALLVVPVGAHSLKSRAVLVSARATVSITLPDPARAGACVVVDGDVLPCRSPLERVDVTTGPTRVRFVQLDGRGFVAGVRETFL